MVQRERDSLIWWLIAANMKTNKLTNFLSRLQVAIGRSVVLPDIDQGGALELGGADAPVVADLQRIVSKLETVTCEQRGRLTSQ